MNTKTIFILPQWVPASDGDWSIQEVSVHITDFICETAFFNALFKASYALVNAMLFDLKFK